MHVEPVQYWVIETPCSVGAFGHLLVAIEKIPLAVAATTMASDEDEDVSEPPASKVAVEPNGRPWTGTNVRSTESATRIHEALLSPPSPRGSHVGVPVPIARSIGVEVPDHSATILEIAPDEA